MPRRCPTGVALLGRFLALVAIIVAFQAAFMVGGMLLQALQGYYHFELGLYLRILFGLNLADHVLLAALAMTIHVLVNQKYLGHIVVLMAIVFTIGGRCSGIHQHAGLQQRPGLDLLGHERLRSVLGPFVWFKPTGRRGRCCSR